MNVEERLKELGLELPPAPGPAANYKPFVRTGNLLFISGQLPMADGKIRYTGHVGSELSEEQGYEAAKLCALNVLAQIKAGLGSFERMELLVRIDGYVSSASGWNDQPRVINGASDLFGEVFGKKAGHARIAVGQNELPLNAAVEVAAIVSVKDSKSES